MPDSTLPDPVELSRAVANIAERSQRAVADFVAKQGDNATLTGAPQNIAGAFFEMTARLMVDPARLVQAQVSLWNDYMRLWQRTTERFMGRDAKPVIEPPKDDKRFSDPAWEENALFDFIKQSYLLSARFTQGLVRGNNERIAKKLDFYTRQFADAMAPSNFALANQQVLRTTVETSGENLVKGLQNMLDDLERGKGQLAVAMTDLAAFKLGETVAITPGAVIHQNDLMQLIQYAPSTETVHRRPLLIVPPWINKFYLLDLTPKNSFIKWAVDQGHTVFVVSWVNPTEQMARKTFEDYMDEGPLAALAAIGQATGESDANVVGYCLGGTLLAAMLAYMKVRGDDRVASATYLTTMVDFAESGELSVFIDEEQIQALQSRPTARAAAEGGEIAATFNMLRANDLIWSFVVNNYLVGQEPFPFDLLYWNSDTTHVPPALHGFYLHNMYQENRLAQPDGISLHGTPIDLGRIETPSFVLATKEDHIAPWKSAYAATQLYQGPVKFCLAGSGHIAGVVNPPDAGRYRFWTAPGRLPKNPEQWLEGATETPGSWWTEWDKWVRKYVGGKVPARILPEGLEAAPGSYVRVRGH